MHLWRALLYTELRSCAEWFFCDSVERKMTVVVRIETVSAEIGFSCTCIDVVCTCDFARRRRCACADIPWPDIKWKTCFQTVSGPRLKWASNGGCFAAKAIMFSWGEDGGCWFLLLKSMRFFATRAFHDGCIEMRVARHGHVVVPVIEGCMSRLHWSWQCVGSRLVASNVAHVAALSRLWRQ